MVFVTLLEPSTMRMCRGTRTEQKSVMFAQLPSMVMQASVSAGSLWPCRHFFRRHNPVVSGHGGKPVASVSFVRVSGVSSRCLVGCFSDFVSSSFSSGVRCPASLLVACFSLRAFIIFLSLLLVICSLVPLVLIEFSAPVT